MHKVVGETIRMASPGKASWPPPKSEQRCTLALSRPIRSTLRLSGVYLGTGDASAVQIGYLPSSNKLRPYVATGAIAACLARVGRRDGMYGAVVYAAVKWPDRAAELR